MRDFEREEEGGEAEGKGYGRESMRKHTFNYGVMSHIDAPEKKLLDFVYIPLG